MTSCEWWGGGGRALVVCAGGTGTGGPCTPADDVRDVAVLVLLGARGHGAAGVLALCGAGPAPGGPQLRVGGGRGGVRVMVPVGRGVQLRQLPLLGPSGDTGPAL